jgi:hypothetical protein
VLQSCTESRAATTMAVDWPVAVFLPQGGSTSLGPANRAGSL